MSTLAAGLLVLLVGVCLRAFGLQAVVWAESVWVRLYTHGLPAEVRDRRRQEIASDIFEQRRYDADEGHLPDAVAVRLLARWVCGIPSDLSWRHSQRRHQRALTLTVPSLEYLLSRPLSLVLAAVLLVVLAPIVVLIAAAVWLERRGPILVRDSRIGKGGVPFGLLRFRVDPDQLIGQLLIASHLHLLPALLNVLKGEMNFVGPKPLSVSVHGPDGPRHQFFAYAGYYVRLAVRPGLTGLAQVYAPRDITTDRQIKYDALYASRTNIWLDLRLILLSFFLTITGRWPHGRRASLASRIARARSRRP
jgi:lipopolysaccharide/colanic/teichoic acid biosynthesis glycosyltransferase